MYKDFIARITKLQVKANLSNPRHMLKKLIQDLDSILKENVRKYCYNNKNDPLNA